MGLTGTELIGVLQEADIIPKELNIRKVTVTAEPDELVIVNYECYLPKADGQAISNAIIAMRAAERMDI